MEVIEHLKLDNKKIIGIDIGTTAVKGIKLGKANGKFHVKSCAYIPIDDYSSQDEISENDKIAQAIQKCVAACGTRNPLAVAAVNGSDVTIRDFNLTGISKNQLSCAILEEAKQVSPLEMEQSIIDYQIIEHDQSNQIFSGVLVACATDGVLNKREYFKKAGVQNVLMDVNSLALLNGFYTFTETAPDTTYAIIDIGKKYTNLIITSKETLPFVRNLQNAGRNIISYVAHKMNITEQMVNEILLSKTDSHQQAYEFENHLKDALKLLAAEIENTFCYYQTHKEQRMVDRIYLCGGFSINPCVEQILSKLIAEPLEVWNPLADPSIYHNDDDDNNFLEQGPAMTVAMGLAMRCI